MCTKMQTKMNLENFIIRLFSESVFSNFDIKLPETISIVRYLDAVADRVFHITRTKSRSDDLVAFKLILYSCM